MKATACSCRAACLSCPFLVSDMSAKFGDFRNESAMLREVLNHSLFFVEEPLKLILHFKRLLPLPNTYASMSLPVVDGPADGQQALERDAHDEEGLAGHHDILQRVDEVREERDVERRAEAEGVVQDHQQQEGDLDDGEADQTLVEGRDHLQPVAAALMLISI